MPQGRRPTHPGDPAPKWGLSRAGFLAIAITVIIGIVVAFLLVTARTAAASEVTGVATTSPSALTSIWANGQRARPSDMGFVVTFPADWTIELGGAGSEPSILVPPNR